MVGIIDENVIRFPLGSRIKVGNNNGTVKYVGEVKGYEGSWLGIEWDDPKRGKHDGKVDNKQYFKTYHPTGGSFIRAGIVDAFESLEDAARERYLSYTRDSVDASLLREAKESMQAAFVEIVGMDKIARKQSKFEQLSEVCVDNWAVNTAGYLKEFTSLTTLNVSHTLLWNWCTIADIATQIPTLINLNLSCNRMQLPTDVQVTDLEPAFRNLELINLSNCGFEKWSDILQTARLWPNIHSLCLRENPIAELTEVNCQEIFKDLRLLDLQLTKIMDFDQICKLGNIPTLTTLNLEKNGIEELKLPDCEPNMKLNIFISLEQLNLLHNPIWNETDAFNELDKLPKLKRLKKTPHMKSDFDEMFSKAVAIISDLKLMNGISIKDDIRRGAEYDIWKKYAVDWLQASKNSETLNEFYKKHRSYAHIIKKYGSPADFVPQNIVKQSKLIRIIIQNEKNGEIWEKKVPRVISVQTLLGLIVKHFHFENQNLTPKLSYIDAKHPELIVPLDNTSKSLDFYSIQDNDTVIVQY